MARGAKGRLSTAPLNGVYDVGLAEAEDELAGDAPVPPPVRSAPFGPIGRETSSVLPFGRQVPATGSQNAVEQFEGSR
jgi:hypothetical protein